MVNSPLSSVTAEPFSLLSALSRSTTVTPGKPLPFGVMDTVPLIVPPVGGSMS